MDDNLHNPQWLADYLGIPLSTVYRMNSEGTGPRRIRVGKHVRYRTADVNRWLDQHAADDKAVSA